MNNFDKKINDETKVPEGQVLKYHALIICKVFRRTEIPEIERLLDLMLKDLESESSLSSKDYREYLRKCRSSLFGGTWINAGGLFSRLEVKEGSIALLPIVDLPKGIKSLHFWIAQTIPSLISLFIVVQFTDEVNKKLIETLNKEYEREEISVVSDITHKVIVKGCFPDMVKRRAVSKFTEGLQGELEKFIISKTQISIKKKPCSITQVYSLSEIPLANDDDLNKWLEKNRFFLKTLGFEWVPLNVSKGEFFLFGNFDPWGEEDILEREGKRIILVSDNLSKPDENVVYNLTLKYIKLSQLIAIGDSFINERLRYFGGLRKNLDAISGFLEKSDSKSPFEKYFRQYLEFIDEQYFSELVASEINWSIDNLDWMFFDVPELKTIKQTDGSQRENYDATELKKSLKFNAEMLKKEAAASKERYNNIFRLMESKIQYRLTQANVALQKYLVIFTVCLVILTAFLAYHEVKISRTSNSKPNNTAIRQSQETTSKKTLNETTNTTRNIKKQLNPINPNSTQKAKSANHKEIPYNTK